MAGYHHWLFRSYMNNLFQHVPKDAICVEVGPHGLLQALLRRSIGPDILPLSLMKRMEDDNVSFCLQNIGK